MKGGKYTLEFTVLAEPAYPPPLFFITRNPYAGGSCSLGANLIFKTYRTPPWMTWPYPPIS